MRPIPDEGRYGGDVESLLCNRFVRRLILTHAQYGERVPYMLKSLKQLFTER